jgi:ribosomal protein S18 acetylase RimI-like enzyme
MQLPVDLISIGEMLVETFQYPNNPEWSVQADEQDELADTIKNFARIWPIIRLGQIFSTSLRDIFRGCVWEEDGKMVGCTMVQRRGSTNVWIVATVGVLPEYRRRGIARKLVERGIEIIREHSGKKAFLDVIDGNLPAYKLYESLGFEHYSGNVEMQMHPTDIYPAPELPAEYHLLPLGRFNWQPRYDLEKRISPENLLKYEPVEEGRFRHPAAMRLILPLIIRAQGKRDEGFQIQDASGQGVARLGFSVPVKDKGFSELLLRMDPNIPELAPYIIGSMLHQITTLAPTRRVEVSIPFWIEPAIEAAKEAGFEKRLAYRRMGIVL